MIAITLVLSAISILALVIKIHARTLAVRRALLSTDGAHTPPELARMILDDRVRLGREHLRRSSVLVCGLARNAEKTLEASLHNLDAALAPTFGRCAYVVLENDSHDRTRAILDERASRDPRLHVLGGALELEPSLHHLPTRGRIEKMAHLRNLLLDEIERDAWSGWDYVLMVDLDLAGVLWRDGLCETGFHFATRREVNAVCALGLELDRVFGTFKYYDPYAHADDKTACMTMKEKDRLLFSTRGLVDHGLEKVASCFNGLTMYRREALRGKRYCTYARRGEHVCEHVCLHDSMRGVYLNNEFAFVVHAGATIDQPGIPTMVAIQ